MDGVDGCCVSRLLRYVQVCVDYVIKQKEVIFRLIKPSRRAHVKHGGHFFSHSIQKGRTPSGNNHLDAQPFFVVMFSRGRIVCVFLSLTNCLELRHIELRSFGKHGVLAQTEAVECIELSGAGSVLTSKLTVGHLLIHGDRANGGLGCALT